MMIEVTASKAGVIYYRRLLHGYKSVEGLELALKGALRSFKEFDVAYRIIL